TTRTRSPTTASSRTTRTLRARYRPTSPPSARRSSTAELRVGAAASSGGREPAARLRRGLDAGAAVVEPDQGGGEHDDGREQTGDLAEDRRDPQAANRVVRRPHQREVAERRGQAAEDDRAAGLLHRDERAPCALAAVA